MAPVRFSAEDARLTDQNASFPAQVTCQGVASSREAEPCGRPRPEEGEQPGALWFSFGATIVDQLSQPSRGRVLKSPHVAARKRPGVRSRRCSCPGPCEHLFATPIVGAAGAYRRVQVPGRLGTRTSRHLIAISLRNARKGAGHRLRGRYARFIASANLISCGQLSPEATGQARRRISGRLCISSTAAVTPPARLSRYLGGQSGYSSLRHARGSSDSAFGVRWSRNE